MATAEIVIEVGGDNRNLYFPPIGETVRGEFDVTKMREPNARKLMDRFPTPIPGQRIGLNPKTAVGYIEEPLYEDKFKPIREKVEAMRVRIGPEEREFKQVHVASWIHRMQLAVRAGKARLVQGQFPDKLPGKPIESFLTMDRPSPEERDREVMEKLAAAIERLADHLGANE